MSKISLFHLHYFVLISLFLAHPLQLGANQINTAHKTDAIHETFCKRLQNVLKKQQFDYDCVPSSGMLENTKRIEQQPSHLGYAHFDVFALETSQRSTQDVFQTIRKDIGKACLFLVTKNKKLTNFGEIAAQAKNLRFILPPENSSHVGTFEYLQQIDTAGLGQAKQILYAKSLDDAIEDALASDDPLVLTMFTKLPASNHTIFKKVSKLGGHFIPVIDRNILRQDIGGEKIYFAEETEIINPNWTKKGVKLVTACTPIALFTGKTENVSDEKAKQDHKDLVRTLTQTPIAQLLPQENFFAKLWKQTKALSASSVEQILEASEEARKAAGPALNDARMLSQQALEAGKKGLEKSQELSKQAYDKAKEITDDVMKNLEQPTDRSDNSTPNTPNAGPLTDENSRKDI
ncbi:MAG: hypothetical protein AAF228_02230 [Pseudomonadota bacterium]